MKPLLLHICCGPCSTVVIERLSETYDVTGFFTNDNIFPEEEFARRSEAAVIAAQRLGIPVIVKPYEHERFTAASLGLEKEPENGARCVECYLLRLRDTARYAAGKGFPFIASTLTVGPRKSAAVIDPVGDKAAAEAGVSFVSGNWKSRDGFKRSCELAREYGLYRQHYCGCEFSMR